MEDTELAKMIRVDRSTRIVLQTLVSREVVEIIGTHGGHEVKGISGTHPLAAGSSRVQALLAPSSKLQASSFKVNNCTYFPPTTSSSNVSETRCYSHSPTWLNPYSASVNTAARSSRHDMRSVFEFMDAS
jgi:hypothetical protein